MRDEQIERLAEALCVTQAEMVGNEAPGAPCDYHKQHARALAPVVDAMVAEALRGAKAEAWDEGATVMAERYSPAWMPDPDVMRRNPYRAALGGRDA